MKILVVDDDEIALAVVKKILENDHHEVVLAEDGDTALEILKTTEIRIIISDWNMPRVTGIDLCRSIRSTPSDSYTYILLVTARSSKEDMIAGLSAGADDFISKPFEPAELIARVRTAGRVLSMEKNVRQSEKRNLALLGAIPDMIMRINSGGIIQDYRPSLHDVINAPVHKVIGTSISKYFSEGQLNEGKKALELALHTKEMQTMEFTLKIGDSSHVFEARLKESGPDEVTAIVRDISDRARLDQMKSDFINRATHELRTPIATMLLMVNLIDGDRTDDEFVEYWDVLKSELNREHLLMEDLLSAGRLESNQAPLHFRYIDILVIIQQTMDQMGMSAREKNINVSIHLLDDSETTSYFINADESALSRVFTNLLGNALKFTPYGGSIDIDLKKDNNGLTITVRDTGIGIPSEDFPMLFSRFFRATNAITEEIPGTGIGLYIVRSIIEKHNGKIKVSSELGKGSTFDLWLPVNQ